MIARTVGTPLESILESAMEVRKLILATVLSLAVMMFLSGL